MKASVQAILSEEFRKRLERVIIAIAIGSFLLHLFIIFLVTKNFIPFTSDFTKNPISAIYTPFSFILVYEVFLLVFYLPKSISIYIGKQYEIITLIVIRRIFKDIGYMELSSDWFNLKSDLQFTYDLVTALILFFLIQQFYQKLETHSKKAKTNSKTDEDRARIQKFIQLKKSIATFLIPIVLGLAIYSFSSWFISAAENGWANIASFKNVNNIFFEDFFILLIVIDVILLLYSFFYSDECFATFKIIEILPSSNVASRLTAFINWLNSLLVITFG